MTRTGHTSRGPTVETWHVRDGAITLRVIIYEFLNVRREHCGYHYETERDDGIEPEVKTVGAMPLDRMRAFVRSFAAGPGATWVHGEARNLAREVLAVWPRCMRGHLPPFPMAVSSNGDSERCGDGGTGPWFAALAKLQEAAK